MLKKIVIGITGASGVIYGIKLLSHLKKMNFESHLIITEAGKLNIDVVAEGVEDFFQAEFLYGAGCETAQGYFYSEPLPIKKFEHYTFGYYHSS